MKIREIFMPDYKKMYTTPFNAVTDAIISIQQNNHVTAKNILIQAQQEAEDIYISGNELCRSHKFSSLAQRLRFFISPSGRLH